VDLEKIDRDNPENTFIAVKLVLLPGVFDDLLRWPFRASGRITLLPQDNSGMVIDRLFDVNDVRKNVAPSLQ